MTPRYHLFECCGIELEYMIVDRATLNVRPLTDEVIFQATGRYESEVDFDQISWSNELVNHVIELKSTEPAATLSGLATAFQDHVGRINETLKPRSARLLPSAMHPWMDPVRDTALWKHEYAEVYSTFDCIFDCRRHGWANVQCVHLNLPFSGDEEFGRLHAAIRLLLPIMPALTASSPIQDGRITGLLNNRLEAYRHNCRRVPSLTGRVIPEPLFTESEYRECILEPIYRDIAPFDPAGELRDEWLNARGAIARFSRGSIEIRILDVQESPQADLAVVAAIVEVLKVLVAERWGSWNEQKSWSVDDLEPVFLSTLALAERAVIHDEHYLRMFGLTTPTCTSGELWRHLIGSTPLPTPVADELGPALDTILYKGPLARRILEAVGDARPENVHAVYRRLADCLSTGTSFLV